MFSMNGFYDKAKIEREMFFKKLIELNLHKQLAMPYFNQALDYKKQGNKKGHLSCL